MESALMKRLLRHRWQSPVLLVALSALTLTGGLRGVAYGFTLNCVQDLSFGMVVNCPAGGMVTVPPSGGPSAGGCVVLPPGNNAQPALCSIANDAIPVALEISIPAPPYILTHGGDTLSLDQFLLKTPSGAPLSSVTITAANDSVAIGATLTLPPAAPSGVYQGSFIVNLDYQ